MRWKFPGKLYITAAGFLEATAFGLGAGSYLTCFLFLVCSSIVQRFLCYLPTQGCFQ